MPQLRSRCGAHTKSASAASAAGSPVSRSRPEGLGKTRRVRFGRKNERANSRAEPRMPSDERTSSATARGAVAVRAVTGT